MIHFPSQQGNSHKPASLAHWPVLSFCLLCVCVYVCVLDRADPPAASSKQQTPQRSTDAAAASSDTEDLFGDFWPSSERGKKKFFVFIVDLKYVQ